MFKSNSLISLLLVGPVLSQTTAIPTAIATAPPNSSGALAPPACASACIQSATQASTCAGTDNGCLCQHTSSLQAAISSCLAQTAECTASDVSKAIAFYPKTCALLGYKASSASTAAGALITAAGTAPTPISHKSAASLVLTATGTPNVNSSSGSMTLNRLSSSAIIGITASAVILVALIVALLVWMLYHHRRNRVQASNIHDLEHGTPSTQLKQTSMASEKHMARQTSLESNPSDHMGESLSRSNTLVSGRPSMAASLDKPLPDIHISSPMPTDEFTPSSLGKRGSSIKKARSLLLGAEGRIRASVLSTHTPRARHNLRAEALSISRISNYNDTMPQ